MKKRNAMFFAAAAVMILLSACAAQPGASAAAGGTAASSAPEAVSSATISGGASAASSGAPSSASSQRVFTLSELKKYNGQNGSPAYVAVSGVVYDVTNAPGWNNGSHKGVSAGEDLTQAIGQAPHGTSVLSGLPVVGTLKS